MHQAYCAFKFSQLRLAQKFCFQESYFILWKRKKQPYIHLSRVSLLLLILFCVLSKWEYLSYKQPSSFLTLQQNNVKRHQWRSFVRAEVYKTAYLFTSLQNKLFFKFPHKNYCFCFSLSYGSRFNLNSCRVTNFLYAKRIMMKLL